MGSQLELLEAEPLQLTAGERAAFSQLLLASLDEHAEIEEAWAIEMRTKIIAKNPPPALWSARAASNSPGASMSPLTAQA